MLILLVRGRCDTFFLTLSDLRAERDTACLSQPFCFLRVVGFPIISFGPSTYKYCISPFLFLLRRHDLFCIFGYIPG